MRVAVISDVHGNFHALEAVLAEIDAGRYDEIWCLGDTVGYGARPNECCAAVESRAAVSLAGNHDLAVLGTIDVQEFAGDAGTAALWTRGVLDEAARAFLSPLATSARRDGAELYHASPRDPVWEYVLTEEAAVAALADTEAPVVLVGHSHVPLAVSVDEGTLSGGLAPAGTEVDLEGVRRLLNPGSVGQPRDGDPRAAYLELDLLAGMARFRRVEYPVGLTQAELRVARLPELLAARLSRGE